MLAQTEIVSPKQQSRDLTKLKIFDSSYSDCKSCELKNQCLRNQTVTSYRPKSFNGLMIIGEGPGHHEVAQGEPFVGRSGQLLRALLKEANIDRDECYLANATLCLPPTGSKNGKELHSAFSNAIYACLPRLEAEIEAVQPRTIIALGSAALIALTGYEEKKTTRVPFRCSCDPTTRKIGPVFACSSRKKVTLEGVESSIKCGWHKLIGSRDEVPPEACPSCGSSLKNTKPKLVTCPECSGLKTKPVETITFVHDYKIGEVAGAIFEASKLPGQLDRFGVKYVVPTYHPSFVLREPSGNARAMAGQFVALPVVKHFSKAKRLLKQNLAPGLPLLVTSDVSDVEEYIYESESETNYRYAIDLETSAWGLDDKGKPLQLDARNPYLVTEIKCIGIGCRAKGEVLVVDTRDASEDLIAIIREILEDETIPKAFQNGSYDITVLNHLWKIKTKGYVDELMVAHHNLFPDEDHDLAHIAFSFCDVPVWKPAKLLREENNAHENFDELCVYNARDVLNTDDSLNAMGAELGVARKGSLLSREGLSDLYTLDMKMARIALQMHLNGMPLDLQALKKVGIEAQKKASDALMRMREIINEPGFEPISPKQLQYTLYDMSGPLKLVPPSRTEKTGLGSTAKDDLLKLAHEPFVQALLDYREHEKIASTFVLGSGLSLKEDGRLHPKWKVTGTRTGRWSSSEPNYMNQPRWLRSCVIAPPGRAVVGADFSQLEMRIIAALCGDEDLIRRCAEADEIRKLEPDHDPHSFVASLAFGKAFTRLNLEYRNHEKENERCKCETCTRKSLREIAKTSFYGLGYGGGAATVLGAIYSKGYKGPPLTIDMISRTIGTIFKAFSRLGPWRESVVKEANERREVRSAIYHRRRVFPLGLIETTVGYNYVVQSSAADLMNRGLAILDERLHSIDPTALLIAQVHDAVYVECDVNKSALVAACVESSLSWTTALSDNNIEMPFVAKAKVGKTWSEVS